MIWAKLNEFSDAFVVISLKFSCRFWKQQTDKWQTYKVMPPGYKILYPLANIQKAIEHFPFIVDFPIKNGDVQ